MKACEFCATRLKLIVDYNTCEKQRSSRTEIVVKLTQKLSGKINLDAGCGDGRYAECFRGNVVGLDLDSKRLRISKGKYGDLMLGSICHMPFRSCAFDYVLCTEVIEHIPKSEGEKALKELERASNFLLITTPNRNKWFQILSSLAYGSENPEHISQWSAKELRKKHFENVRGCLGWVTAERVPKILQKFWNLLAWYFVEIFGGDLIAMKAKSSHVFRLYMNTWKLGTHVRNRI